MSRGVLWLALFLVANVVRLLLVDAGPDVGFEHLRAASGLARGSLPALDAAGLAFFAALLVVVLLAARADLAAAAALLRARFGVVRACVLAALLVGTACLPTANVRELGLDVVLSSLIRLSLIGLTWLVVRELPRGLASRLDALLDRLFVEDAAASARSADRLPRYAALGSFFVSALLSFFAYERVPHIPDEVAYLFQARYFAEGLLYAPAPPVTQAFEVYLVGCEPGHCASPFPPGFPAVLALGVLLGAPFLVNPALGGANVLLTYAFTRELWGARVGRLAALSLAVSPWHLLMSMSFMSHTFSLTCALVAAYGVARSYATGKSLPCVPAGAAIGLVTLTRPLEGVVVAAVLGLAALSVRGRGFRFLPVLVLALSTAAVTALNAPYNQALSGDPKAFPVSRYMDDYWGKGKNDLGFGPSRDIQFSGLDPFPGHGLRDVLVNSQICLSQLQTELFGWGAGSLWLASLFLLLGAARRLDAWLLLWLAAVIGSQALYWFGGGPDFGARYWYTAIVPLVILSARGLLMLSERPSGATARPWGRAVVVMSGVALAVFIPWRAIDKYHEYRGLGPGMRELLESRDFGRSLLLVRGRERPDYAGALNFTPIDPQADAPVVLWAKDAATEAALRRAYEGRPVFVVDGPSRTGSSAYRVATSPSSAPAR